MDVREVGIQNDDDSKKAGNEKDVHYKPKHHPFLISQSPDSLTRPSFILPISDKFRILDLEDSNTLSKRFAYRKIQTKGHQHFGLGNVTFA